MSENCPRCKSGERVKSGMVHGMQRWLCKACGCNYTKSTPRGYQDDLEKQAVEHYLQGISLRKIEALMGISNVTVSRWVRNFKNRFLTPVRNLTVADVQVRCHSIEEARELLEKQPQNLQNRWVLMELPIENVPADGVVVVQSNGKSNNAVEDNEPKTTAAIQ